MKSAEKRVNDVDDVLDATRRNLAADGEGVGGIDVIYLFHCTANCIAN